MKKSLLSVSAGLFALVVVVFLVGANEKTISFDSNGSVYAFLKAQGMKPALHEIGALDPVKVEQGKSLVTKGYWLNEQGKKSKIQSRHYQCIHCHNITQEDPDWANPSPEKRINYAKDQNIGLVQGTTLYGIVNREHWYNGDYDKKYGDLVVPTRDTLVNAIQLCATVCSQGRALDDEEMESVLHYLWSIELTLGDLEFSEKEKEKLVDATLASKEKLNLVKSKYYTEAGATFLEEKPKDLRGYGAGGNPEIGKVIYTKGCMWCHNSQDGVTNLKLDDDKLSLRMLKNNLKKDNDHNVYHITRKGTYPIEGYKPYMPHYTAERLTDQQIEDLVAYIKEGQK